MVMKESVKRIQLSKDCVSPSEASDMIQSLIKKNVNYHKLRRLSMVIGDENADTRFQDQQINRLLMEKERLDDIIADAREQGCDLYLKTTIEIARTR